MKEKFFKELWRAILCITVLFVGPFAAIYVICLIEPKVAGVSAKYGEMSPIIIAVCIPFVFLAAGLGLLNDKKKK